MGLKGVSAYVCFQAFLAFLVKIFSRLHSSLFLRRGMLCPKLGGVAGPFSLAGLLNWGGAKTGNSRVEKDRDDQGTNGD